MSGQGGVGEQDVNDIEELAARWLATMRGPQAEQQKDRFEAWLAHDMRHREAYARMRQVFEDGIVLRASAQFGPSRKRRWFDRTRKTFVPAAIAASIAIVLVIGLSITASSPWPSDGGQLADQTFETPPRTIRTFTLPGGGALTLDQASKAIVSSGEQESRIKLIAGRMQLHTTGRTKSYVITAGASAITARSSVLDVHLADQELSFARLYSGHAEVRPLLQNAAYVVEGRSLPIGRALQLSRGNMLEARESFVADERDWPSGWAQYRSIPLSRLVGIANQYAAKPIVLDDPAIGAQAVSGRFRFNNAWSVAQNLATIFGLVVIERSDGLHLQQR